METLKFKTSELLQVRDELSALLTKEKLTFLAKFKISDIYKGVFDKCEAFDKVRREMIEKYGELDESKENFNIPEENQTVFTTEMQGLLDSEIELSIEMLDISLIGNLETENVYFQVFRLFKG